MATIFALPAPTLKLVDIDAGSAIVPGPVKLQSLNLYPANGFADILTMLVMLYTPEPVWEPFAPETSIS